MSDGRNPGSKRPNFLALVNAPKVARSSGLTATMPLGVDIASLHLDAMDETMAETTSPGGFGPAPVCDRGTLTMVSGTEAGSVYHLGATTTIGRSPECEIHIDHAGVSRRHARIVREGEAEYEVVDLGSRNGTAIRGRPITRCRLVDGDRIAIGPVFFRFALTDEKEALALKQRYEFSVVDGLTGAINRKHFDDRLIVELAYAKRHQSEVSLLILDVDHFKAINDKLGHQAGDLVLRQLATSIKAALRAEDVFARYGGEEFAIIARGIASTEALAFAERVRRLVNEAKFVHDEKQVSVSVSVGVAALADCKEPSVDQLVGMADSALYAAKASGRNACRRAMRDPR
jgi:two-component system, cell cycle response regulator